jgi:hypothetical protein
MNFSTGELVFNSNFKNKYPDRRSGLNATEVTSYQYLGMTKIAETSVVLIIFNDVFCKGHPYSYTVTVSYYGST